MKQENYGIIKKKIEVEKLMSRETEKMNKALQKFLEANTTEKTTEDEMDSLIQVFIKEYNKMKMNFVLDARTAKTSDDFYELAKMTEDLSLSLKDKRYNIIKFKKSQ